MSQPGLGAEPDQLFLLEVVDVAQAAAASPPIDQEIARVHFGRSEAEGVPGDDLLPQTRDVEELPDRNDGQAARGQTRAQFAQKTRAAPAAGDVKEHGEADRGLERFRVFPEMITPSRGGQVGREQAVVEDRIGVLGLPEQAFAEVYPAVAGNPVRHQAGGQGASHAAVPTTEVEERTPAVESAQGAKDAGREHGARGGEVASELIVEFTIEAKQPDGDRLFHHPRIIAVPRAGRRQPAILRAMEDPRVRRGRREGRFEQEFLPHLDGALAILREIQAAPVFDAAVLRSVLRRHPLEGRAFFSKNLLARAYQHLCLEGVLQPDSALEERIRTKPVRTISGVAPVTVLTKPFPCPGRCLFCPTDEQMPKSYLPQEPGAQRALQSGFDPRLQVTGRIRALSNNGHPVDKIELLILGGCWSSYPRDYQEGFVKSCLDAMNGFAALTLEEAQQVNESAPHRNVGLVIETRPDLINAEEIRWLRRLGVTKVQLGVQSLDDAILQQNQRGHDVEAVRRAMVLLRAAGMKLVVHWMPNLLGATPESDLLDFERLWLDPALRPDEIKIYPCSLVEASELHSIWRSGGYTPYSDRALISLIAACKKKVPAYCRVNRIFRDIPSTYIIDGCRRSNLREAIRWEMVAAGERCGCIRCREVRGTAVVSGELRLQSDEYTTTHSRESFLSFCTTEGRLAGYARLSLPGPEVDLGLTELTGAALIREVHVYGPALHLGSAGREEAQHRGLGTRLLLAAEERARGAGFARLAVIASVGTRPYYAARGFAPEGTYMVKELTSA
jgi:elongator complex protein 3